jgi:hypothetical protein
LPSPDCKAKLPVSPAVAIGVRLAGNWQEITPNAPRCAEFWQANPFISQHLRGSAQALTSTGYQATLSTLRLVTPQGRPMVL